MNDSIFREKSLAKVQSPDNLNEYIQVSNPGIWILLVSIVFLLLGFCVWGCFGQLQTVVRAEASCENGVITCLLSDEDAAAVRPGMAAQVGGQSGTVAEVSARSGRNSSCTIETETPRADGSYEAQIVVESIHPISFLLN